MLVAEHLGPNSPGKAWVGGAFAMPGVAALAGAPWPAMVLVLVVFSGCGCLCAWLRYREQVKRRSFEHDERMRALDKAPRSQIADLVAKFDG